MSVDAHLCACLLNTAFQYVPYAKFLPNLFDIHGLSLIGEDRIAGDDKQLSEFGKSRNEVVGDAVAKIRLLEIATQVLKRQHGDGSPL